MALGPLRLAYAARIVRWLRDPVVRENLGLRAEPTLARTRAFIRDSGSWAGAQGAASAPPPGGARPFAILLDDRHVGNVVLDQIDVRIGKARLHVYIGEEDARGRGVGKRAVTLAVRAAFEELGLHKVWLTVHERNASAVRAYEGVGFRVEGRHRREFFVGGELVDELYMGVLRGELSPPPERSIARRPVLYPGAKRSGKVRGKS